MPDFRPEVNAREAFVHADARAGFAWTRRGAALTEPVRSGKVIGGHYGERTQLDRPEIW